MTPEKEFDSKVRAFHAQLVKQLLDQCTPEQQKLFKMMYPPEGLASLKGGQFRRAYGQCFRTISKNAKGECNVCETCGAKDGRAGLLVNGECLNCHETRETGKVVRHAYLRRTFREAARTAKILDP